MLKYQWIPPIRAVAFDMDGLMVNTEELYTQVGQALLQRRGKTFTAELKKAMMGLPGPQAYAVMIASQQLEDAWETLAAESDEIFAELLPRKLRALPGLVELLDWLDARSLPRCIATSSTHRFVDRVLEIIGLTERFDFVVTAEDVACGKPAPDIYLAAAARLQIAPSHMLVLEDSHHGTRAGLASGACTIAVPGLESLDHDFSGVFHRAESLSDAVIYRLLEASSAHETC